ncbi:MAG: hypothetical protein KDA22_05380 [Phycisphaerales bacterium]|nr:hypothetical protein [Phycisphaerales bacterium]
MSRGGLGCRSFVGMADRAVRRRQGLLTPSVASTRRALRHPAERAGMDLEGVVAARAQPDDRELCLRELCRREL